MADMEFKFDIDLKPYGKVESFQNKEEFQQWLQFETTFWQWGDISKKDQHAQNFINSINYKIGSIHNTFNNTLRQTDPNSFRQQLEQLKNLLGEYYRKGQLFHSSLPASKYLNDIKDKSPVNAIYVLKFFIERKFDPTNRKEVEGAFAALLFESGIKGTVEAEKASLQELRDHWQGNLNSTKDDLRKIKEQYDHLLKEYADKKQTQSNIFQEMLELSKKEHQEVLDKTKKEIHDLLELYKSKLGLHSAIEYWEVKAVSHRNFSIWFTVVVLACFGLAAWGLYESIKMFIGEETIQSVKLWKLGTLALGATIGVWLLRVLIRLLLSNYHLMSDANERKTMLLTYLALQQEKKLPAGESVHLILQALFRPTSMGIIKDDAVPPFMAAWLRKTTGDD